ncbi:MAG: hypothetical protein E6K91_08340 [Thaumarchaeota archaeon]|nr:MAG: hypothetical protein E6K91_08340 [Nitrososphaerota archaeon]
MQKACDAVKENPFCISNQGKSQGDDDNGHHGFECNALAHGVLSTRNCMIEFFSPITKVDKTMEIIQMDYTIITP